MHTPLVRRTHWLVGAALGLASPLALANPEISNVLYGQFRFSLAHVDTQAIDGSLQADDNASRLGLRGTISQGGVTAFYQLETAATNDAGGSALNSRFYFAGLRGSFGQVVVGRHSPAYKMPAVTLDPLYDLASVGVNGQFTAAAGSYGSSRLANGFANNSVAYTSPALGPVTLNAGVYLDDSAANKHSYAAGALFKQGDFDLGFQYFDAGEAQVLNFGGNVADAEFYRLHGSYKVGALSLGASVEVESPKAQGAKDITYVFLAGAYQINPANRLGLSVGSVDEGPAKGTGFSLGLYHTVLPNAQLYFIGSHASLDNAADDSTVIGVGFIYNFSANL